MSVILLRGDARELPLPDGSADLVLCSPPYFGQRDYRDGNESLKGQIGAEETPREYIAKLLDCTREWVRVLKPGGSIFVNLGDKYATRYSSNRSGGRAGLNDDDDTRGRSGQNRSGVGEKSLLGLPERYMIGCIDDLGLIVRAEIIWSKVNGLPESVTDRVRRSHEHLFHLTTQPRYYSAVDEIREPHAPWTLKAYAYEQKNGGYNRRKNPDRVDEGDASDYAVANPLGKLPGSVWQIASQPLLVPARLGLDHFACVDAETEVLTRRGWLRHEGLRDDDEVAGCDLDTGVTRWTQLHGIHRYDYDGEMVTAEARGLSMRLTPNHRTLAHAHRGVHRLRGPLEVVDAADLDQNHAIPRAVEWSDDGREKSIGADMAALCGWVAAEGWYQAGRAVRLSQSATVNAEHVAEIDAILVRLGTGPVATGRNVYSSWNGWRAHIAMGGKRQELGSFSQRDDAEKAVCKFRAEHGLDLTHRTERQRDTRSPRPWTDVVWRLADGLGAEVRRLMPDKLLTAAMADLPIVEAQALLDAFIAGDGHIRPDGRKSVFQKERANLDVLQAIAVRCGYNTTLRKSGGRWVLYLNPPRPARLRHADGASLVGREHYRGVVWCVTTGTGTFVARRNGSVFVTGNSWPMAIPRQIILGWSPPGICSECGEGRRPVGAADAARLNGWALHQRGGRSWHGDGADPKRTLGVPASDRNRVITGYSCACTPYTDHLGTAGRERNGQAYARETGRDSHPHGGVGMLPRTGPWREYHIEGWPAPPTRPAIVVDPFGGTGTSALVADALGRVGVSIDRSADYCRLARWRTTDPAERARALQVPKPPPIPDGQLDMFAGEAS